MSSVNPFANFSGTFRQQVGSLLEEPLKTLTRGVSVDEAISGLQSLISQDEDSLQSIPNRLLKGRLQSLNETKNAPESYIPREGDTVRVGQDSITINHDQYEQLKTLFDKTFCECIQNKISELESSAGAAGPAGAAAPAEAKRSAAEAEVEERQVKRLREAREAPPESDMAIYGMPVEDLRRVILDGIVDDPGFLMTLGRFGILREDPEMLLALNDFASALRDYKVRALRNYQGRPFDVSVVTFVDDPVHQARLKELYERSDYESEYTFDELVEGYGELLTNVFMACEMSRGVPPEEGSRTIRDQLSDIYVAFGGATEQPDIPPPDLR